MGAYDAFHQMALAAAKTDPTAPALSRPADSTTSPIVSPPATSSIATRSRRRPAAASRATPVSHILHNELNAGGATLTNAGGESWRGYGDGHYADKANAANRVHTAEAQTASYGELQNAITGKAAAPGAHKVADLVPKFDKGARRQWRSAPATWACSTS